MNRKHYIKIVKSNLDIQYIRLSSSDISDPHLPMRLEYFRKQPQTTSAHLVTISPVAGLVRLGTLQHETPIDEPSRKYYERTTK